MPDVPIPASGFLDQYVIPSTADIVKAVKGIVK
jgi:pyruvate/2-oxoglutarate/acetoin dehydrogenase E1 component